jgi:hypothetical protein
MLDLHEKLFVQGWLMRVTSCGIISVGLEALPATFARSFSCALFTNASLENDHVLFIAYRCVSFSPCFFTSGIVFIDDT